MEGVWATGKLRTNRGFIQMNTIPFRKIKKFLDKKRRRRKLENIPLHTIINFQRIPKFHFHKSEGGRFEANVYESNTLAVKTISG